MVGLTKDYRYPALDRDLLTWVDQYRMKNFRGGIAPCGTG